MARTKGCLSEEEWIKCPKSPHVLGQLMSAGSLTGVCVGSVCKVPVFWQKDLQDFFFLTEKQTQLFKYSIFYALSSLLTTAPVSSLFVAEDAGLVTTLMAAAHAAGKNTDI